MHPDRAAVLMTRYMTISFITKEHSMTTATMASTSNVISSERVEGTSVYNQAGDKLGSIDDLMIDKLSGRVRYAVLEFGGFLGIGTDRYPLPGTC